MTSPQQIAQALIDSGISQDEAHRIAYASYVHNDLFQALKDIATDDDNCGRTLQEYACVMLNDVMCKQYTMPIIH